MHTLKDQLPAAHAIASLDWNDRRRLGVWVERILRSDRKDSWNIPLDHPGLVAAGGQLSALPDVPIAGRAVTRSCRFRWAPSCWASGLPAWAATHQTMPVCHRRRDLATLTAWQVSLGTAAGRRRR